MSILCLKQGVLTTIQDLGRYGSGRLGINPTGAMDTAAVRLINTLLGNDENEAVLELHFPAGEYRFERQSDFALGGANFHAELDGKKVTNWCVHRAEKGKDLRFKQRVAGNRAYLAVTGGLAVDDWLGSSCTNLAAHIGGFEGRTVGKGDSIPLRSHPLSKGPSRALTLGPSILPYYRSIPAVRILAGAEFDSLTAISQEILLKRNFEISPDSNRMGFKLDGELLYRLSSEEMVSFAVSFGTVQLLPDGHLIILMADHQTTGGYPRIAHVISRDLPLLAQLGPGDKVGFHLVSIEEAETLAVEFEDELRMLRNGVRLANLK